MECHPLNRESLKKVRSSNDGFAWSYFLQEDQRMIEQEMNQYNGISYRDVDEKTFSDILEQMGYNRDDIVVDDKIMRVLGKIETKEMVLDVADYINPFVLLNNIKKFKIKNKL